MKKKFAADGVVLIIQNLKSYMGKVANDS